mmetsp:Transcript_16128/g.25796  ORF Transcript_16128/g.25796 Transcript_16128/m.25796 type:complete len:118 (+) Transcript_16128:69-422(+)
MARRASRLLAAACLAMVLATFLQATAFLSLGTAPRNAGLPVVSAAVVASMGMAGPAWAAQSLEDTLQDNSGVFIAFSILITVVLIVVPGLFAMAQSNKGKFQEGFETPEDYGRDGQL